MNGRGEKLSGVYVSAEKIEEDSQKAENIAKEKSDEKAKDDDDEVKKKHDEQKDEGKPAPKEIEKGEKSNPRHDPEDERPGANDSGYGAHRNSGDETNTTDHDPGLDS